MEQPLQHSITKQFTYQQVHDIQVMFDSFLIHAVHMQLWTQRYGNLFYFDIISIPYDIQDTEASLLYMFFLNL